MSDVTAIVVSHDSGRVLPTCLAILAAEQLSIILVDNASSDHSIDIGNGFGARVLKNARNEGFGRAMNIGMRAAETALVLLLNPDIELDPGAITRLLAAAEQYPNAAILAPRIVEPDGRVFFPNQSLLSPYLKNERGVDWTPEGDCCTPFLLGACLLIRRDAILALGGFDPEIFLFYEDDDLCRRVIDAGYSLVHVNGAIARHERGGSSAPVPGRTFKVRFHLAWSRLYVAEKWKLTNRQWPILWLAMLKWIAAAALFNSKRKERYAGSISGYLSYRKGITALAREGLE